jgi:hypothetical protein
VFENINKLETEELGDDAITAFNDKRLTTSNQLTMSAALKTCNAAALFSVGFSFIQYASVPSSASIPWAEWNFLTQVLRVVSALQIPGVAAFDIFFWFTFILMCVFLCFCYLVPKGKMLCGEITVSLLSALGDVAFLLILKWQLSAWDCSYSSRPIMLDSAPSIQCWVPTHLLYFLPSLLLIPYFYSAARFQPLWQCISRQKLGGEFVLALSSEFLVAQTLLRAIMAVMSTLLTTWAGSITSVSCVVHVAMLILIWRRCGQNYGLKWPSGKFVATLTRSFAPSFPLNISFCFCFCSSPQPVL